MPDGKSVDSAAGGPTCIEQNFGPHMLQKWALLAGSLGSVASWNTRAVSGSRLRLNWSYQRKSKRAALSASSHSCALGWPCDRWQGLRGPQAQLQRITPAQVKMCCAQRLGRLMRPEVVLQQVAGARGPAGSGCTCGASVSQSRCAQRVGPLLCPGVALQQGAGSEAQMSGCKGSTGGTGDLAGRTCAWRQW